MPQNCNYLNICIHHNKIRKKKILQNINNYYNNNNPKQDINRLYVSRKEGRRGFANIEDSMEASFQGLKDNIKKSKEKGITVNRNSTNNIMINKETEMEKKQLYGCFKKQIDKISHEKTWTRLRRVNFKRETESLVIAAQKEQ